MELRTYTSLWQVEKRLYALNDITLPVPVSFKQIGMGLLVGIPNTAILVLLGVPFKPPFPYLFYFVPPVAAIVLGNRPVAEGKKIGQLAFSQMRYLLQSKFYARLRPWNEAHTVKVRADIWHRNVPVSVVRDPELPGQDVAAKAERDEPHSDVGLIPSGA